MSFPVLKPPLRVPRVRLSSNLWYLGSAMNIPGDPGVGPQSAPQGIVEGHADEVELALAEGRGAEDGAAAGEAGPLQLGVGTEDC